MQEEVINNSDIPVSPRGELTQEDNLDKKVKKKHVLLKIFIGLVALISAAIILLFIISKFMVFPYDYVEITPPGDDEVLSVDVDATIRSSEFCEYVDVIETETVKVSDKVYKVVKCFPPDWHSPYPLQTIAGILIESTSKSEVEVIMFKDLYYKVYLSESGDIIFEKEIWVDSEKGYFESMFGEGADVTPDIIEQLEKDKSDCFIGDGTCAQFKRKEIYKFDDALKELVFVKEELSSDSYFQ